MHPCLRNRPPKRDAEPNMLTYPFEVPYEDILKNPDQYVEAVFSSLESEFLNMPKGEGFIA
jgi:hypothetical protein